MKRLPFDELDKMSECLALVTLLVYSQLLEAPFKKRMDALGKKLNLPTTKEKPNPCIAPVKGFSRVWCT
jgi:hypothetical protein